MAEVKKPRSNRFLICIAVNDREKMLAHNLDTTDIMILRWMYDWYTTRSDMEKKMFDGEMYYWISNNAVVTNFTTSGITSVAGARKRLLRLCGEEGNESVPTPLLKRKVQYSEKYGQITMYHLNEPLFFSITARSYIGDDTEPLTIEEEFNSIPQDKAIEVPAEEPSNCITPETISFIDKVLSLNSQFSKPRINLTDPSKALMNIQTYRQELLDGSFIQRHQNQLPANLRSVVLPTLTEADLLARMAGVKLTNKIGIGDYFLSYNHNTKSYSSMFLSYMAKATKDKSPVQAPKALVTEVKTTGMHPSAVAYMNDKQKEAHAKLGVTDIGAVARVADSIYSWYEDHPNSVKGWQEYMHPKNLLWAMKNFMEPWKEKTGKSADEFYKTLSPFDTSNRSWTLFARYMWKNSNVLLHNKLSCPVIQDNEDAWYWIDYKALRVDID